MPVHNANIICDDILDEITTGNIKDRSKGLKVFILCQCSKALQHKPFKEMTREDILLFLNSARKSEQENPNHSWIGNYNSRVRIVTKFMKWLHNPKEHNPKDRKMPKLMNGIIQLPRKEKSKFTNGDMWSTEEQALFLHYCSNKREDCSGRRDSIKRHIGNKNIHDGNGTIIPIAEYYAGVNSGLYNPSIDRLINTKNRIRFDHQAPGQKTTSQEADPIGPNKRHPQVGKGGEIYLRRAIEGFADKIVEDMTSDWKNKPIEYKLEVMVPFLKSYDRALAGEIDLGTYFEEHVVASRQADLLLEFVSSLNRGTTQSAAKNNEVSNLKQEPQRENRPADIPKADTTDNLKRDPPQGTVEQAGGVTSTKTIKQEDVRAEIAKVKQLLGKKPDQTITRGELFIGCTKFPEIGKIVLKLCRMEAADKGLDN